MKKANTAFFILIFLATSLPAQFAIAEIQRGAFSFSALYGIYIFETRQRLEDGNLFDIRLGYNFSDHLGGEAVFNYLDTEFDFLPVSVDGYVFHLDGLYHFQPEKKFVPYLAAGIGGIDLEFQGGGSDSGFLFNWGGGLKLFLSRSLALRGDVRHIIAYSNALNNFALTLGLTYQFGGKKGGKAIRDRDSDKDTVFDQYDACPDTPAGAPVDSRGCPIDSDGDGVFDYLDTCPETPADVPVNSRGCPLDSDGDGIFDPADECPDTPAGIDVDEKGCPVPLYKKVSLTLNVEFESNSAQIDPVYHQLLKRAARFMEAYPKTRAMIEGHTDSTGPADKNLEISQKRADALKNYLVDKFGIDPSRIKAVGYGETRPIAENRTRAGREQNRRVLLRVLTVAP